MKLLAVLNFIAAAIHALLVYLHRAKVDSGLSKAKETKDTHELEDIVNNKS